jgi:hypothetical protein
MADALVFHRLQFALTLMYHYLFPQLTMGLALLIVFMKALGLRRGRERWNDAARFWIRIFGINFAVGVVTGIPMEFQFGTNWAKFSRYAGSVIGQTLAMEGLFAFFLESSFLSLLVWGERRLSKRGHFLAAVALLVGSWLSGYNFAHRDWARALRRAELRRVRFHDLRHTYASLLIAQGAHPKYIQVQLGHASIQTTLDRYGHLMPDAHAAEAQKLDRLVFGDNGHDSAGRVIADAMQRLQNGSRDDKGVSEDAR